PGHVAQLGGADGREVLGVREENRPAVADPVMKADRPLGRLGSEIRSFAVDSQCHGSSVGMGKGTTACRFPPGFRDLLREGWRSAPAEEDMSRKSLPVRLLPAALSAALMLAA